jgi:hypothetical protein
LIFYLVDLDIVIALIGECFFAVNGFLLAIKMAFTLQLLHALDFECGIDAASTSPEVSFSAVLNHLRINSYRQNWQLQLIKPHFFSLKCPLIFTHSEFTPELYYGN